MRYDQFLNANSNEVLHSPSWMPIALRWAFRLGFPTFIIAILAAGDGLQILDRAGLFLAPVSWLLLERLTHRMHGVQLSKAGLTMVPSGRVIAADRIDNIRVVETGGAATGRLAVTLTKPMFFAEVGGTFAIGRHLSIPVEMENDVVSLCASHTGTEVA